MVVSKNTCIYEYERILLGLQNKYELTFQGKPGCKANQREFGAIWNYAITKMIGWNAQEADTYLTVEIVKKLKLDLTYSAIDFNPATSFIGNFRFALQYAFPGEIKYDFYQEALDEYKRVAKKNEWSNDTENYKYHKNFFQGIDGYGRAKIILNHLVQTYLSDLSTEELYDLFSNKSASKAFLEEHRLTFPAAVLYQGDALVYFHDAYRYRNSFYYYAGIVNRFVKQFNKKTRKRKEPE